VAADFSDRTSLLLSRFQSFRVLGEDVFGNMLVLSGDSVFIVSHEDGSTYDTQVDGDTFLDTLRSCGYAWIDYYSGEALRVFEALQGSLRDSEHIHWIHPLALGGVCSTGNATMVDRKQHIAEHLKLMDQLKGTNPGDNVASK